MWDYHNDKLLQALVLQYEFDFLKVVQFLNKNTQCNFTENSCRQRYKELYVNKKKGKIEMSPLQKLILQKNNLQQKQNSDQQINFDLMHSQLLKEEDERIQKLNELKFKQHNQAENEDKKFFSKQYLLQKQEKEQEFFRNISRNLTYENKNNFQIYYLEQKGENMTIKTADYNSKQGQVQRQKIMDSVKNYSQNFDREFNKYQEQENLPISSKLKLFSSTQIECDDDADFDFDI